MGRVRYTEVQTLPTAREGLLLTDLNTRLQRKHQTAISQRSEKTWRAYLLARPDLFVCDPKGPQARVRLR